MADNRLYKLLFDRLNTSQAVTFSNSYDISITKTENPKQLISSAGNIEINAYLPKNNSDAPNYMQNIFLKDFTGTNTVFELLKNFVNSSNFLATDVSSDGFAKLPESIKEFEDKGIKTVGYNKNIDLTNALISAINDNKIWRVANLNAKRDYDKKSIENVVGFLLIKMNELIDYIITNDCDKANNKIKELVRSMFMDQNGNVYSFAHNTLILPALMDLLGKRLILSNAYPDRQFYHAIANAGYVKKNSKVLHASDNTKWDDVNKWNVRGKGLDYRINMPFIIQTNQEIKDNKVYNLKGDKPAEKPASSEAKPTETPILNPEVPPMVIPPTNEKPAETFVISRETFDPNTIFAFEDKDYPAENLVTTNNGYTQLTAFSPYNYPFVDNKWVINSIPLNIDNQRDLIKQTIKNIKIPSAIEGKNDPYKENTKDVKPYAYIYSSYAQNEDDPKPPLYSARILDKSKEFVGNGETLLPNYIHINSFNDDQPGRRYDNILGF